jgi:hypothetical protein
MPIVNVQKGQTQAESITGVTGASTDVARIASNLSLANHIGTFVAGQVANQFLNENLADTLKGGQNMVTISGSWG